MLKLISKILGLVSLALAVIIAVLDLTKSIADSKVVLTSLGEHWVNFNTTSLQYLQVGIQRKFGIPWAWDTIFVPLLQMPGWLVFGVLAIILLWLARPKERGMKRRFS
ncbi:MAG: hypothetical protein AB8B49_09140 [Nitratireductor sp.]